jgi:hypothetical protein
MPNKDSYIKLRKALDSITNVSLAEYDLLETVVDKKNFVDFVSTQIEQFLNDVASNHRHEWETQGLVRAKQFEAHAVELNAKEFSRCPPGFHEVDGICVPI